MDKIAGIATKLLIIKDFVKHSCYPCNYLTIKLVGTAGFEPATPCTPFIIG